MRHFARAAPGLAVVAASFGYTLPAVTSPIDDHFMHVAWGRQLLEGRLPLRDMVEPGLPLQAALSALSELIFGHRLMSEAIVVGAAFAAGALLTFLLARRASGSAWIGVAAAALQIAIAPRTYSYPKIVVYAAGIALMWWYVDRPSRARLATLVAAVAAAFYLRHDHGLYLGAAVAGMLVLRHAHEPRLFARRLGALAAGCAAAVAPYLIYVQVFGGLDAYVRDLSAFAAREHQRNRFEAWPRWPIASLGDLAAWSPHGPEAVMIGVRWSPAAPDESRRAAAARHKLQVPDDGPVESGRYLLTDISRENSLALIDNAVIEDTSGLDRGTGIITVPGFWLGRLHVLPPLDAPAAAASFLFFVFLALPASTAAALAVARRGAPGPLGEWERVKMGVVVIASAASAVALLREPLAARIGDAVVAPLVLAAWWAGRSVAAARVRPWWSRAGRAVVALLVLVPVARSVIVVGAVPSRLEGLGLWPGTSPPAALASVWERLTTTPPFDAWDAKGSAKYEAVRYVRACTPPGSPLLVLWFAPDLYYYAGRPFAGRLGFYMEGYWTSLDHERANLARIERERPIVALSEAGHEPSDLRTYPALVRYLADAYTPVGELPGNDGSVIRVLVRKDAAAVSPDPVTGWPCYPEKTPGVSF